MKSIIQFSKIRYLMYLISIVIIIAGVFFIFINNGFNLGIDFTGGLDIQFQVAPAAMKVEYSGEESIVVNIAAGKLTIEKINAGEKESLFLADYDTISSLANKLNEMEGITASVLNGYGNNPASSIISLSHPISLNDTPLVINVRLLREEEIFATIDKVRTAVEPLSKYGNTNPQQIGDLINQEFTLKVQLKEIPETEETDESEKDSYVDIVENDLRTYIESEFGADTFLLKKSNFIAAVFSVTLIQAAIWSIVLAFTLIFFYISFRFKKFIFAFGAILALIHDVSIMVGFTAALQLEVSITTIGAVLTIIGYSLNDTIVVFDRIRENMGLMPDATNEDIINTSITQSLSRTIITSLTTLLAVITIFIFSTGVIKVFAFNLIIGIVVGTYSSIFIASPLVLSWQNAIAKRKKDKLLGVSIKKAKTDFNPEQKVGSLVTEENINSKNRVVEVVRKQISRKKKKKKKR